MHWMTSRPSAPAPWSKKMTGRFSYTVKPTLNLKSSQRPSDQKEFRNSKLDFYEARFANDGAGTAADGSAVCGGPYLHLMCAVHGRVLGPGAYTRPLFGSA